jgi:hypothetical protein
MLFGLLGEARLRVVRYGKFEMPLRTKHCEFAANMWLKMLNGVFFILDR